MAIEFLLSFQNLHVLSPSFLLDQTNVVSAVTLLKPSSTSVGMRSLGRYIWAVFLAGTDRFWCSEFCLQMVFRSRRQQRHLLQRLCVLPTRQSMGGYAPLPSPPASPGTSNLVQCWGIQKQTPQQSSNHTLDASRIAEALSCAGAVWR